MSTEHAKEEMTKIRSMILRLNDLHENTSFCQDELHEAAEMPRLIIDALKQDSHPVTSAFMRGFCEWNESETQRKIDNAMEGFENIVQNNVVTDDQLSCAIEMNEIVLEYLERRMSGPNVFSAGLVLELNSLKNIRTARQTRCDLLQRRRIDSSDGSPTKRL